VKTRLLRPAMGALLVILVSALSGLAAPPPQTQAVLDASPDKVWDATLASLRDGGYRISRERRSSGFVEGQLARPIRYGGEEDPFAELKRISRFDQSIPDVRVSSEYRVILGVELHPADGERTRIDVHGQVVAVQRARGRRGAPRPIPLVSSGVVEEELLDRIRERLGLSR
jgi:hypothetical protein